MLANLVAAGIVFGGWWFFIAQPAQQKNEQLAQVLPPEHYKLAQCLVSYGVKIEMVPPEEMRGAPFVGGLKRTAFIPAKADGPEAYYAITDSLVAMKQELNGGIMGIEVPAEWQQKYGQAEAEKMLMRLQPPNVVSEFFICKGKLPL